MDYKYYVFVYGKLKINLKKIMIKLYNIKNKLKKDKNYKIKTE